MSGRILRLALAVVVGALLCDHAAFARRPPASGAGHAGGKTPAPNAPAVTPIDEFERMSPEQEQRELERLPPGQRQKLRQRLQRFNQLPAEQQRTLRNLYNRLHQLPANQQESVRKAINRFSEQPADRQQAMRDELRTLAPLSQNERTVRLASREFRGSLSRREQGVVKDMLPVLPGP